MNRHLQCVLRAAAWCALLLTNAALAQSPAPLSLPGDTRVLISADENARHKQVLGVLNAVRDAGVEKVSFEAKP